MSQEEIKPVEFTEIELDELEQMGKGNPEEDKE